MDRTRIARRLGGPATRRRRHRRVALLAALVTTAGVGLFAIGSGERGENGGEEAVTAGDPVAAACRASNEDIGTAQQALLRDNETHAAVVGFFADAFVDLARDRAAAIRAADPPPSAEVLALVERHDAIVDGIEADPETAAGLTNPFDALNEEWRSLGLDDCAIDSSTVPQD